MYLTTVIDLTDRKVVGWSLSEDMTTKNTVLKGWITVRNIKSDFIFHSDRGIQYAAKRIRKIFNYNIKIKQSMGRKGNCREDVITSNIAESFFKTM